MKHNLTINADGVLGIGIIYHKAPVISLRNTKSTKWSRFRVFTGGTDKCLVRNTVNPLFVNAINNSKIFSTVYLYHIRVLGLVVNGFFFLNFLSFSQSPMNLRRRSKNDWGRLDMGYETYRIADLIDEIAMGPFGSNIKVSCFVDSGVPVLNGSNLEGFSLSEKTFRYVTRKKADSLNKANAHRGDIVITHRGTLGQIVFIPQDSKYDRYVISQSQFRVRCNDKVLPEYLVYYFHTPIGQHKLLSNASQVGVPALARPSSTFQQIEVVLPELSIQKCVVEIISTIQKKIVNNQELNDNLAALSWTADTSISPDISLGSKLSLNVASD